MSKNNDKKLIKSRERVRKYGEVFTPERLVKEMCDMLEKESPDAFMALTNTFLEPACGTGNFLVEILQRKLALCKDKSDGIDALNSIYGVDILSDNIDESRKRMKEIYVQKFGDSEEIDKVLERNIVCGNFLTKTTLDGNKIWFLNGE